MPPSSHRGLRWLARFASSRASPRAPKAPPQRLPPASHLKRSGDKAKHIVFPLNTKKSVRSSSKERLLFSRTLWRAREGWDQFKSTLRPEFRANFRRFMWLLPWIPIAVVIDTHYYTIMRIKGPSMTPALNKDYKRDEPNIDDRILVDLQNPNTAQRGDIVAFRSPQDPEKIVVKRIIAVQGDLVQPLPPHPTDPLIVQWGQIWVEGDNEDKSQTKDSNWYGPIPRALIVGRALAILWPLGHFESLPRRSEFRHPRVIKRAVNLEKPEEAQAERYQYWIQEKAKVEENRRLARQSGQIEDARSGPSLANQEPG